MADKIIGTASGNRHEAELSMKEQPNSNHKHNIKPEAQKIPKLATCSPLLLALAVSDCHTLTVAMMPPVPRPRKIRAMMNWAN